MSVTRARLVTLTVRDTARFWSHVVKGPGERDCWLWTGAIADDGYGRFTLNAGGRSTALRPHRVAFSLATGISLNLDRLPVVEHLVCDNPICVRASGDSLDHLAGGTQATNIARIAARPGATGRPIMLRGDRPGRAALAARSRALRDAVSDGWKAETIAAALARIHAGQDGLW